MTRVWPWLLLGAICSIFLASLAISQPALPPNLPIVCAYNTSPPTLTNGQAGFIQCDSTGHQSISGTVAATQSGIWQVTPTGGTGAYTAVTVGTSDSTILAASTAVHFLDIVNASASAAICINFGATATISGTQCAAGEIALPPLWHRSWENSFVPTDAIHAIASAAATPASLGAK